MEIFLTGGHGFIGSHLVRRLVAAGHTLRCLVRPESRTDRIDGLKWNRAVGDVRDRRSLVEAMVGAEAVIHLAAVSSWEQIRSPALRETVEEGTANVLEVAAELGVRRAVHVSSTAALSGAVAPVVHDEGSSFALAGRALFYAEAKLRSEQVAREVAARSALEVVIVNPAETYGPGDDQFVTAGNLLDILRGWPAIGCVGGTSIVHVEDVAAGIEGALARGRSGERYVLAGENLTIRQLIEHTLAVAGQRKPIVVLPTAPLQWVVQTLARLRLPTPVRPDVLDYATLYWFVDNRKAREELGLEFRPAREVLAPTIAWLVRAGHLDPRKAPALA